MYSERVPESSPRTLTLTGSETIHVLESSASRFEVEVTYPPHGTRPPRHTHPHHSESFTVLSGTLRVGHGVGRSAYEQDHDAGSSFDIPSGVVHRMWNAGAEPTVVRWLSSPGSRVAEYFEAMDRAHRGGRSTLFSTAGIIADHGDVMRPASRATRIALRVIAPFGRRTRARRTGPVRRTLATVLTATLALGISYVGVSYLLAPAATAPSFGMAVWPRGEAATFLATKGARDLVSGLIPLALLVTSQRRALGWVMTVTALVPAMDAALILMTGGSTAIALSVHALTAVMVLGTGVLLLTEPAATDRPAPTPPAHGR